MKRLITLAIIFIALAGVMARAIIPTGYMPGGNAFEVVICTIDGAKTIAVDGDDFNPQNKKPAGVCEFNLVNNLALDTDFVAFAVTLTLTTFAYLAMRSQIASRALRLPGTQSRAPPLSI
jgi:hypothetical protein